MQQSNKLVSLTALVIGLITASSGLAQTCNNSIPSKTPSSEFTLHGDGTVTHHRTGLMWEQCLAGQSGESCTGTPTSMTWSEALTYGANHEFAGYKDWRVPNIKELASIVEDACYKPAVNLDVFPGDLAEEDNIDVWSSSTSTRSPNSAAVCYFNHGGVSSFYFKYNDYYVRLVRDSQ